MKLNIFARKATRVLRVLLVDYGKDWNERQLAREANVSHELVHYVFKKLIEMKLSTKNEQNRFVLTGPLNLLRKWASHYSYDLANKFLGYFVLDSEFDLFIEQLVNLGLEYSLSGIVAAWLLTRTVQPGDFRLYVPSNDEVAKIAGKTGLNPAFRGAT